MTALLSAVPLLLFGAGFFYLIRLRFFYIFHPVRCLAQLKNRRSTGGISPFRAMTVALAGTLGVGNIVGVATALYLGGPGAVFWMLVSALVAMVLKYAEITLALAHRRQNEKGEPVGGASYYIADGLALQGAPKLGKALAWIFALLCLVNAVTMGGVLQINAVAGAMEEGFSVPPLVSGVVLAVLTLWVVRGGARGISALTERLVPFMTVAFLLACVAVLILRRERLGDALLSIWEEAFHPVGVGSGIGGFLLSRGIRYGVMRGLISNEAGCGTAPMAHASADTDSPAAQGIFGLVEVFVDTVLLCTITALVILVSDCDIATGEDGVRLAQAAFTSVLGDWAGGFFALSILFFGGATVLCWAHYGLTALSYLTCRPGAKTLFSVAFAASLVLGAVAAPTFAWSLADGAIAVMTILNLFVLLLMHKEVEKHTNQLFSVHRKRVGRIPCEGDHRRPPVGTRKE